MAKLLAGQNLIINKEGTQINAEEYLKDKVVALYVIYRFKLKDSMLYCIFLFIKLRMMCFRYFSASHFAPVAPFFTAFVICDYKFPLLLMSYRVNHLAWIRPKLRVL